MKEQRKEDQTYLTTNKSNIKLAAMKIAFINIIITIGYCRNSLKNVKNANKNIDTKNANKNIDTLLQIQLKYVKLWKL